MFLVFYAGIATNWGIDYPMVHIFGVNNTSLGLLLTLDRTLYNVLSFLVIWGRYVILRRLCITIFKPFSSIMRIVNWILADTMLAFNILL